MNDSFAELLRFLGYPLGTGVTIVVLGYILRQSFVKLLENVVAKDIEGVKQRHQLVLEDKKAELGRETERLKALLSVEAETYRLAANEGFKALLSLWESSESLLDDTDFSDVHSVQRSLSNVQSSLRLLRKTAVVLPPSLIDDMREYFVKVMPVLTQSEESFDDDKSDIREAGWYKALTATAALTTYGFLFDIVDAAVPHIVPSIVKQLEKKRRAAVEVAREGLETALRRHFGVTLELPIACALPADEPSSVVALRKPDPARMPNKSDSGDGK